MKIHIAGVAGGGDEMSVIAAGMPPRLLSYFYIKGGRSKSAFYTACIIHSKILFEEDMRIHVAGLGHKLEESSIIHKISGLLQSFYFLHGPFKAPLSHWHRGRFNFCKEKARRGEMDLFLDSGAFSAFTQGVDIDIYEYIDFIKEHKDVFSVYANLDSIGDPVQTWKNQRIMEREGLNPLPCFHYGEDLKWLRKYLDKYDHIALGGMVPISNRDLQIWLDDLWRNYLTDEDGLPIVKIHGFGLTSHDLMLRYPWHSTDSTSWVVTGRMGSVYVPFFKKDAYDYSHKPYKVAISAKSPTITDAGKHFENYAPNQQKRILTYIEEKGFAAGKSSFREEAADYEPDEDEKWGTTKKERKATGRGTVETIIEPGLCNDYRERDKLNIIYFQDMEAYLDSLEPRSFKPRKAVPKPLFGAR